MFKKIFIIIAAPVLILLFLYGAFESGSYLLTKKEAIGYVDDIQEKRKVHIIISYYNEYKDEETKSKIVLDYEKSEPIYVGQEIKVYYQKYFNNIYSDYKKPMAIPLLIMYILLLSGVIYGIMPGRKKKKS